MRQDCFWGLIEKIRLSRSILGSQQPRTSFALEWDACVCVCAHSRSRSCNTLSFSTHTAPLSLPPYSPSLRTLAGGDIMPEQHLQNLCGRMPSLRVDSPVSSIHSAGLIVWICQRANWAFGGTWDFKMHFHHVDKLCIIDGTCMHSNFSVNALVLVCARM